MAVVYGCFKKRKGLILTGKSQQAKGRRAELELTKLLQSYGYDVRPGEPLSYGAEPDLVGLENIHVEVKRRESVNLSAALAQAEADAQKFGDGLPAVFHRKNREDWRVTMPLMAWLKIYQRHECQCGGRCNQQETGFSGPKEGGDT